MRGEAGLVEEGCWSDRVRWKVLQGRSCGSVVSLAGPGLHGAWLLQ